MCPADARYSGGGGGVTVSRQRIGRYKILSQDVCIVAEGGVFKQRERSEKWLKTLQTTL